MGNPIPIDLHVSSFYTSRMTRVFLMKQFVFDVDSHLFVVSQITWTEDLKMLYYYECTTNVFVACLARSIDVIFK